MYPLPDGLFAARNQWYIAAWSEEVTREPMERWILDEPVALYRTESGKPVALEGRCPHRSFPLGRSRVSGDNIQCGYHGITFRPDGSCAAIPSQSAVPAACRVRSYPIVEQWRWLWIWMGDPALADESLIPSEDELGLGDGDHLIVSGGYNLVAGRYMLLHDNLFDLTHVGYLHMPSFGSGGGAQDTVPEVETGQNWVSSVYTQRNCRHSRLLLPVPEFQWQGGQGAGTQIVFAVPACWWYPDFSSAESRRHSGRALGFIAGLSRRDACHPSQHQLFLRGGPVVEQ